MSGTDPARLLDEVIDIMKGLSGEWEYSGPISPETRFFADMELRSLDFVILSTAIVRRYGRLPFDELYSELAEKPPEERELTVREYVQFVAKHLGAVSV